MLSTLKASINSIVYYSSFYDVTMCRHSKPEEVLSCRKSTYAKIMAAPKVCITERSTLLLRWLPWARLCRCS